MALKFPPIEKRTARDQDFVNRLVALEESVGILERLDPLRKKLVYFSVSFAAKLTSEVKGGRTIKRSPQFQEVPEVAPADRRETLSSAFSRAIHRDAAEYVRFRQSTVVLKDAPDPPMTENEDVFPGLSAYRISMGV